MGTDIHVSLINPGPIQSQLRSHAHDIYQTTVAKLPQTPHQSAYQKLEREYFGKDSRSRKMQLPAEAVMPALIHALESPRPRIRYVIGKPAKMLAWLHKILPEGLFMRFIAKISGK
jgi:short-subunit dehydrogenase